MKTLTSYYNETIRFLTIAGKEYSDAHPDTARYLNRDNLETVWPGFEDIVRGLGFLGARIHALLDRTRNDFYADLVKLFWPTLAQDIPSLCLMQFTVKKHRLTASLTVPRGTVISSDSVSQERTPCLFSTTQDVRISPIGLTGISKKNISRNSSEITFQFSLKEGLPREDCTFGPLRIHLVGELPVTIALHELLTHHVTRAKFTTGDTNDLQVIENGKSAITPGGMGPDEPLLPSDGHSNFALSYLTEYFVFREKFLCLDLHGLDHAAYANSGKTPSSISVTLTFDCVLPEDKPFAVSNFRLFCTPAINLFRHSIEPVAARLTYDEYPLCADNAPGASIEPHSIISVTSYNRSTGACVNYAPMTTFVAASTGAPTWLLRFQTNAKIRRREALLYLGGRQPINAPPDGENISVEAWCSNGDRPHNDLHEGDIANCATLPIGISATNLTRPTERAFPRDDVPLAVLSTQLGAYYDELTSANIFSAFLKAYDRSGSEGNRRRTESILKVTRTRTEARFKGTLLHGLLYTIVIDEKTFSDLNDLHLFGQILAVFLSRWSRMETFIDLTFVCKPSDRTLFWSSLEPWIQKTDGIAPPAQPENDTDPVPAIMAHDEDRPGFDAPENDSSLPDAETNLDGLMQKIEHEARTLNFFGTIRLFEGYFAARGTQDPFKNGHLLLVPDTALSFPSSDIAGVERHDDHFIVRCAFLGLTGASSPLPVQWSQIIIEKPETAAALLALLSVFNRRFYELFYEANKKYRLDPLPGMYEQDPLIRRIAALGGILPHQSFSKRDLRSLSFITLFAASPRSATGLATILSSCMGNIPVSVRRFMPHCDTIPQAQQTQLCNRNCTLGTDAMLGSQISSRAGKFRITFGPLKRSMFEGILSAGYPKNMLNDLIESYIANTLEYDLEFLIRYGDLPPAALGSGRSTGARLGVNAGLGAPALPMKTNSVVIEGRTFGGIKDNRIPETARIDDNAQSGSGRTIDKYFEEDVRSLYESARSFAAGFPRAGRELSITSSGTGDPVVARLFQGAAFHSARVREILDDTLPELSERLVSTQWPEFLFALPSATIVEFTPRKGSVSETQVVQRGTELLSKMLSGSDERIVFTTSQSITLNPITLESVDYSTDSRGKGRVALKFQFENGITWAGINLDPLRLYLHAEEKTALSLHRMFLHETEKVSISYDGGGPGKEIELGNAVRFPFCGPDYRMLHTHTIKSDGFASLIEYNAFKQKFLFIDLHGFHDKQFSALKTAPRSCTVTVFFNNDFPHGLSLGKDTFRLFCSPAVNIFKRNAAIVPTGIKKDDYTVAAPADSSGTLVPHSVLAVSGLENGGDDSREYLRKNGPAAFDLTLEKGTWEPRFRQGYDGRQSIQLELNHGAGNSAPQSLANITIAAVFSNGTIPHTELSIGDIAVHATGFPDRIDFVNLTRPTLPSQAPRSDKQWHFMALAGATPAIPINVADLRQLLKLFDWSGDADKNSTIKAIVDFYATGSKWVLRDSKLLRGMEYTLTLDESTLVHTYDQHLFGQVLCEFLQSKTLATSFVSLVIIAQPSGTTLQWKRRQGTCGDTN